MDYLLNIPEEDLVLHRKLTKKEETLEMRKKESMKVENQIPQIEIRDSNFGKNYVPLDIKKPKANFDIDEDMNENSKVEENFNFDKDFDDTEEFKDLSQKQELIPQQ